MANLRSSPFDVPHKSRVPLRGGVQLSLDLSKAFDRLPRSKLEEALRRINVHPDQIQLILYIHYEMLLVFCKNEYTSEIHTNSGIRQGCGLAPLLWTAYTLLTLEKLEAFLSRDQLTAFADDYHVSWEIESLLQFNNCCVQIGRIIDVLTDLGMQISTDKTAILLLLGGSSARHALQNRVLPVKADRWLQIPTKTGTIKLPIRKEHKYLGTITGYGRFERSAVSYRVQQAWHTFNRLHRILTSKALPLSTRVRLWRSCVGSVLLYMSSCYHARRQFGQHATHAGCQAAQTGSKEPSTHHT